MGVVTKKPQGYRAYFRGASEILVKRSNKHVAVRKGGNYGYGIEVKGINELSRKNISRTVIFYANQTLRTISYRDFESWPPGTVLDETGSVSFDDFATDLTLIALTGVEDPLRDGVRDVVLKCQRAGVLV
jgi:Ca2+-transporting ATPase